MGSSSSHAGSRLALLSAFTGAGGLDLGLEHAAFHVVACLETDRAARDTLELNRPAWPLLGDGDVATAAARLGPADLGLEVGELSVLVGGPPCQPFSKAAQWVSGARSGIADGAGRGTAVKGMTDLVARFLPHALLIENVVGFVKGRGSARATVERALEEVNVEHGTSYHLQVSVLDAADYGVPQHRVRAIGVARRDGAEFKWPVPTHTDLKATSWDAIGDLKVVDPPAATGRWAPLLPSIPEGHNYQWHTERGGGEPLFGYRTKYWSFLLKLARDRPSWTIPASPGPSTGPFHWDNRPLSVTERLRLQSFPVDWRLTGGQRDQIRLVGNATPPLLAEVLGRAIAEQVFGRGGQPDRPALRIPKARTEPVPAPTRPVPAFFFSMRGKHPAHPGVGRGPGRLDSANVEQADSA